jgi:ribonuclease Z
MLTVIYLGTGAALPAPGRDNTSLAVDDGRDVTLIDASGSPLKRLSEAGVPHQRLARVIITHQHLDHTFGFPSLVQSLALSGRREPLPVYAQPNTWIVLDRLLEAYRPSRWVDALPIERHVIEAGEAPFLETGPLTVRAAPTRHSVPTVGLRLESEEGSVLTYTSDTSPCEEITALARGADVLVHEATFPAGQEAQAEQAGHSTARQAGETALAAGVGRLVLIHFTPPRPEDLVALRQGAAAVFSGPIDVPGDLDRISLP